MKEKFKLQTINEIKLNLKILLNQSSKFLLQPKWSQIINPQKKNIRNSLLKS